MAILFMMLPDSARLSALRHSYRSAAKRLLSYNRMSITRPHSKHL
jgi:hypothetical protein